MTKRTLTTALAAAGALLAGTITGCSTPADASLASSTVAVSIDPAARALLPANVAASGTLTFAMDPSEGRPWATQSSANGSFQGLNHDLADAIARKLGLRSKVQAVTFDDMIPGLQAGRFQFSSAPMLDTPTREKKVDFVNYLHGGSGFVVATSAPDSLKNLSLATICGLKVGVSRGTVEAMAVTTASAACVNQHKPPATVSEFDGASAALTALMSGRVQAYDGSVGQMDFITRSSSKLVRSGASYNSGLSSMAFPKGSPLAPAVRAALQSLIDSGEYRQILDQYGLTQLALTQATINAGTKAAK